MNKTIYILIKDINPNNLCNKLIKNNIRYRSLQIINKDIRIKINYDDLELIKSIFIDKTIIIIKYNGILYIKNFLKNHYIFLLSLFISYIILIILSNIIFNINIETNNEDIKYEINKLLNENNIHKYCFKKSYKEIERIKKDILDKSKDSLEWIEIKEEGVNYNILLTPRVNNNYKESNKLSNIVSTKEGVIKNIIVSNGQKVKEVNECVKKGDIIISGEVKKGEEIKKHTDANGRVFAEVWYKVNTTIPYKYTKYIKTNEKVNHYYIKFLNSKMTLWGKYDVKNALIKEKVLIDKPYMFFKLIKEEKELYNYKEYRLDNNEAKKEAIKISDEKVKNKLKKEEYIIDKTILKENSYPNKYNIELFYRVYEEIGKKEYINEYSLSTE